MESLFSSFNPEQYIERVFTKELSDLLEKYDAKIVMNEVGKCEDCYPVYELAIEIESEDGNFRFPKLRSFTVDFKKACEYVGLEPTKRQRRKWENGAGLAYRGACKGYVKIDEDVPFDKRKATADDQMSKYPFKEGGKV